MLGLILKVTLYYSMECVGLDYRSNSKASYEKRFLPELTYSKNKASLCLETKSACNKQIVILKLRCRQIACLFLGLLKKHQRNYDLFISSQGSCKAAVLTIRVLGGV